MDCAVLPRPCAVGKAAHNAESAGHHCGCLAQALRKGVTAHACMLAQQGLILFLSHPPIHA
jgi:hypothetical protein